MSGIKKKKSLSSLFTALLAYVFYIALKYLHLMTTVIFNSWKQLSLILIPRFCSSPLFQGLFQSHFPHSTDLGKKKASSWTEPKIKHLIHNSKPTAKINTKSKSNINKESNT